LLEYQRNIKPEGVEMKKHAASELQIAEAEKLKVI